MKKRQDNYYWVNKCINLLERVGLALFLGFILMNSIFGQANPENYRIYDAKGNPATLNQILDAIGKNEVVFLGEQHDDSTAHALQAEIFRKTMENYAKGRKVALSLEMFERDVQTILNEYLAGLITEKKFLDDSRPWGNYKTDYRPLVEYAKQNQIPVIAANSPRRYVNMVSRNGREALSKLSPEAKKWLPPLPYSEPSKTYGDKFKALMGASPEAQMGIDKILASQSLWDAGMSYSISEFLKQNKDALIVHLNGAFHTENRLGTVEHFLKYRSKAKVLVVTLRYEDDFKNFDKTKHTDIGDFVILTDAKQPRSQR